jgi:hypothetical protein
MIYKRTIKFKMKTSQNFVLYDEKFNIDNTELKTSYFIETIEKSQFQKEISKIRRIYLNKRSNYKAKTNKIISKYLYDKENEGLNKKLKKNKSSIIISNLYLKYDNSIVNELYMSDFILSSNRTEILNKI